MREVTVLVTFQGIVTGGWLASVVQGHPHDRESAVASRWRVPDGAPIEQIKPAVGVSHFEAAEKIEAHLEAVGGERITPGMGGESCQ